MEAGEEIIAGNTFQVEVTVKLKMLMYETACSILGTLPSANYNSGEADNEAREIS